MDRKTDLESIILELRITLLGTKPPIWRSVAVPSGVTLAELHEIVQIAMGWFDEHLHQFIVKSKSRKPRAKRFKGLLSIRSLGDLGRPFRGERVFTDLSMGNMDGEDESSVTLGELCCNIKDELTYEYDFGDGWQHTIEVTKTYAPKDGVDYPVCLAGKQACPQEDCGGVWGYYEMLDAVKDPKHPEHETYEEWLDPDFDPEVFDREEVNSMLAEWKRDSRLRLATKGVR